MKKPKIAIVPFSEIAKSNGLRLDAGYYLGIDEEKAYERARKRFRHAIKRLFRTWRQVIFARLRVLKWKYEGRIKYK